MKDFPVLTGIVTDAMHISTIRSALMTTIMYGSAQNAVTKTAFLLIATELLWFLKGDTNVRTLIAQNNHIWDEWAFEKWVTSTEYTGPDMTDFCHRRLTDKTFNQVYLEQMANYILWEPANFFLHQKVIKESLVENNNLKQYHQMVKSIFQTL